MIFKITVELAYLFTLFPWLLLTPLSLRTNDSLNMPCGSRRTDFLFTSPVSLRCDSSLKLNLKALNKCKLVVPFWTHFEKRVILLQRWICIKYGRVQADSGYQTCHGCVSRFSTSFSISSYFLSIHSNNKSSRSSLKKYT